MATGDRLGKEFLRGTTKHAKGTKPNEWRTEHTENSERRGPAADGLRARSFSPVASERCRAAKSPHETQRRANASR